MSHPDKFFISGMGKSGSTWLQLLLNSHPEIVCLGEGQLYANMPTHLNAMIDRHNQVQHYLTTKNFNDSNIPTYPTLESEDMIEILRFAIERVFARFPITKHTRLVGDKSPQNTPNLQLIDRTFPNARIIHITRDPRDVLASTWHHWQRTKPGGLKKLFNNSIQLLAKDTFQHWLTTNTTALQFRQQRPAKTIITSYENLSADPHAELKKILVFLKVDCADAIVGQCIDSNSFRKLSGRSRGDADNAAFFRRGQVGAWKDELDAQTLNEITPDVQELMTHLGY